MPVDILFTASRTMCYTVEEASEEEAYWLACQMGRDEAFARGLNANLARRRPYHYVDTQESEDEEATP